MREFIDLLKEELIANNDINTTVQLQSFEIIEKDGAEFKTDKYHEYQKQVINKIDEREKIEDKKVESYQYNDNVRELIDSLMSSVINLNKKIESIKEKYSFENINLKLHDVSYHIYKNQDKYEEDNSEIFDFFAQLSYEDFCNFVLEGMGLSQKYIGRTSSFHFYKDGYENLVEELREFNQRKNYDDLCVLLLEDNTDCEMTNIIAELCNDIHEGKTIYFNDLMHMFNNHFVLRLEDSDMDNHNEKKSELNLVIDDLTHEVKSVDFESVTKVLDNIADGYEWVDNFKEHQVKYFEEFVVGCKEHA